MMRAFGVEITPLFLAILSSSSSVCGGEPTQGEEGKKKERETEKKYGGILSGGRTGGKCFPFQSRQRRQSGMGKRRGPTAIVGSIAFCAMVFNDNLGSR